MIKLYFSPGPNPAKVLLMLEETGLDYEIAPLNIRKGEQFTPAYLAINPNAKAPSLIDGDASGFDSTAILLYLAEKTGQFLPPDTPAARGQLLSWLMFISSGLGPYSGHAVHFRHIAPEPKAYALNRYDFEAERHWNIVEAHLAKRRYMVGEALTIADFSLWGWGKAIAAALGPEGPAKLPNVARLLEEINARPAAVRTAEIAAQYAFKEALDDEGRKFMFPQNERLPAG